MAGLALVAALLALPTAGHPSGLAVADAVLRAGFAAGVVWFAGAARRWTWFPLIGVAAVLSTGAVAIALAVAALALAYLAAFAPRRLRLAGGIVGLVAVQLILRLPHRLPAVLTAVIVAAAVVPCLWSGYKLHRRRTRRHIRHAAEALVLIAGVAVAAFGLSVIQARSAIDSGVSHARAALQAARAGDQEGAVRQLNMAVQAFHDGQRSLGAWWAQPARTLPVVGVQANAVDDVIHSGTDLARHSLATARVADYRRLRASKGQIDLPLLESYVRPVTDLSRSLDRAEGHLGAASSPWLLPPLQHQIDSFNAQVSQSATDARLATEVLKGAPDLLGAHGPRRYALLFSTPAETRELGGFTGNIGELTAVNGKLTLERTVRSTDLFPRSQAEAQARTLPNQDTLPVRYRYYQPTRFPGNITGTQDFPTVARSFGGLYPQTGGQPVDGVIYVDPYGLAGLLKLTGPVAVEGLSMPLTSANAADFLLKQQYVNFTDFTNRVDYLENASRATFEQLTNRELPGPRAAADALSPLVKRHRILAYSFHSGDQPLFDRLGLAGGVPALDARTDYLSVTDANGNPNKIDAYLERDVADRVRYDPATGKVSSTVSVTLRNTAPGSGLPDYTISNQAGLPFGTNRTYLSVYSSLEAMASRLDGRPVATEPQIEAGRNRYGVFVNVPPGGTAVLEIDLAGSLQPGPSYQLAYLGQPVVNPDQFHVQVTGLDGQRARRPFLTGPTDHPRAGTVGASEGSVRALVTGGVVRLRVPFGHE